jgi:hypothetical protein
MNFFGHAALAVAHFAEASPGLETERLATLCAGAMLPDFVGMLRLSRPLAVDPLLARGVAFHHKSDEAFHDLPAFQRLSRQAFAWLSERHLPRGPARAVAHIGIEMLLDEVLAGERAARDGYRAALRLPLDSLMSFTVPGDAERLTALRRALLERAATEQAPPPELVAERIARTLSRRPRLATDAAGQALFGTWVALSRPLVAAEAPEIFAMLRERLANFGGAE